MSPFMNAADCGDPDVLCSVTVKFTFVVWSEMSELLFDGFLLKYGAFILLRGTQSLSKDWNKFGNSLTFHTITYSVNSSLTQSEAQL